MDDETIYPSEFTITHAKEHDVNQMEVLVNKAEATYVFDRGYLDFERLDQMNWDGYFFVTRIKKNTQVHVIDTLEKSPDAGILKDELVQLGSSNYLTSLFRLVTVQDEKGRIIQILTNRMDLTSKEIADLYKARWKIELFFKHIKQNLTVKTFYSNSEVGVQNQLLLAMITVLLTLLIQLETKTTKSIFQIKRFFRNLTFKPFTYWFEQLVPT